MNNAGIGTDINPKNMTRMGNFENLNVGDVFGNYPGDLQIITSITKEKFPDATFTKTNIMHVDLNGKEGCTSFFNDSRSNFKAPAYLPSNE